MPDDPSIVLWGAGKPGQPRDMATRELALAIGTDIISRTLEPANVQSQLPLEVVDAGDSWIVRGTRAEADHPTVGTLGRMGNTSMTILKRNCEVARIETPLLVSLAPDSGAPSAP